MMEAAANQRNNNEPLAFCEVECASQNNSKTLAKLMGARRKASGNHPGISLPPSRRWEVGGGGYQDERLMCVSKGFYRFERV